MKTQTSAVILDVLAKFPSFIICERTLKFVPKRKAPLLHLPPTPPPSPRFPFLLGEYLAFCGLSLHQGNMRSRKNHEQQFAFFLFFSVPTD